MILEFRTPQKSSKYVFRCIMLWCCSALFAYWGLVYVTIYLPHSKITSYLFVHAWPPVQENIVIWGQLIKPPKMCQR